MINNVKKQKNLTRDIQNFKLRRPDSLKKETENTWCSKSRKPRKNKISEHVKEKVKNFYLSSGISRENPNKKAALRIKKNKEVTILPRHNMLMSLEEVHRVFVTTNPEVKIGFTSFRKLRPLQVTVASETNQRSCLCEKCSNVAFKTEALQRFKCSHNKLQNVHVISSKRQIVAMTMCDTNEKPKMKCVNQSCANCGTKIIKEMYKDFHQFDAEKIKWRKWECVHVEVNNKKKNIMSCVCKA